MVMLAFLLCLTAGTFPPPGTSGTPTLPAELEVGMTNRFLIDCVIFLVIPAIWTFFYNSRHVKLTCERRDPVRRWTDACPLPVLGFCIWLLFSALMMLIMPIAMQGVMPFFGMFLTGWLGALFYLAIAALLVFAADLVYRLDSRGWWLIVLLLSVQMISSILTFALRDVMEMYRLMDYPQAQMDPIEKLGMFKGYIMMWIVLSCTLPVLGYLFYIKKYFRPRSAN